MRLMEFDCRRHLCDLLNRGDIEKEIKLVGRTKTAFWKLKGATLDVNLHDPLRKKLLHLFERDKELTTLEISDLLKLNHQKIYKYLGKLEKEEFLIKRVIRDGSTFRANWKLKDK